MVYCPDRGFVADVPARAGAIPGVGRGPIDSTGLWGLLLRRSDAMPRRLPPWPRRIHRKTGDGSPGDRAEDHPRDRDLIVGYAPGHEMVAKSPAHPCHQVEGELPTGSEANDEQDGEGRTHREPRPLPPEPDQQPGDRCRARSPPRPPAARGIRQAARPSAGRHAEAARTTRGPSADAGRSGRARGNRGGATLRSRRRAGRRGRAGWPTASGRRSRTPRSPPRLRRSPSSSRSRPRHPAWAGPRPLGARRSTAVARATRASHDAAIATGCR